MDPWSAAYWSCESLAAYAIAGYAPISLLVARLAPTRYERRSDPTALTVSFVIAAHDEEAIIARKIANCRKQGLSPERMEILVVADGSQDRTADVAATAGARTLYELERRGKAHALVRGVLAARGDIVVLTDANAMLVPGALDALLSPFADPIVAAVAGAKRVVAEPGAEGEGLYWKIENAQKRADAALWSVMGGAGELLAVRRDRFPRLEPDTLLDDFVISLRLVAQGYRVAYAPRAIAEEVGVPSIQGEFERKARIVCGGHQAVFRLGSLGSRGWRVWLPYYSHRVLRWVLAPWLLCVGLLANVELAAEGHSVYRYLLGLQLLFWAAGAAGGALAAASRKAGPLALPWQLLLYWGAAMAGALRYYRKRQPVAWARVSRRPT